MKASNKSSFPYEVFWISCLYSYLVIDRAKVSSLLGPAISGANSTGLLRYHKSAFHYCCNLTHFRNASAPVFLEGQL